MPIEDLNADTDRRTVSTHLVESSLSCRTRRSCSLLVSPFWSWPILSWSSLMMAWLSDRVRFRDWTRSFWFDSSSSVFCRLLVKRSMVSCRDWDLDSKFWICLFKASMRSCKTCKNEKKYILLLYNFFSRNRYVIIFYYKVLYLDFTWVTSCITKKY